MRPAIVLGFLVLVVVLRVAFGTGPEGSFDDRFERTNSRLEEMARSIEADLKDEEARP